MVLILYSFVRPSVFYRPELIMYFSENAIAASRNISFVCPASMNVEHLYICLRDCGHLYQCRYSCTGFNRCLRPSQADVQGSSKQLLSTGSVVYNNRVHGYENSVCLTVFILYLHAVVSLQPGPHRTRQHCTGPVCDRPSASRPIPSYQSHLEAVLTVQNGPGRARTVANRVGTAVRTGLIFDRTSISMFALLSMTPDT